MKRTDYSLFLLILTPLFLVGAFLLWFVSNHPDLTSFSLAIGLLASLSMTSFAILLKLRRTYINPIANLEQQLEEPALSLHPEAFKQSSPIHAISNSISQKLNQIESRHSEEISKLVAELDHSYDQLNLHSEKLESSAISSEITDIQLELTHNALADFIVFNNLIKQEPSPRLQADLDFTCEQLVFLLQELQCYTYPNKKQESVKLCNIVDDAVFPLSVFMNSKGWNILPIFETSCPPFISVRVKLLKSLIFNFALHSILESKLLIGAPPKTNNYLILTIELSSSGQLSFSLSGFKVQYSSYSSKRLESISSTLKATLDQNSISLPLDSNTLIEAKDRGSLRAKVDSENSHEKRSMENRLKILGLDISEDLEGVDFYFFNPNSTEQTYPLSDSIKKGTKVIIWGINDYFKWGNNTPLAKEQLSFPLMPGELEALIFDNTDNLLQNFDQDLALKRANNRPQLMNELLDILISTLRCDIKEIALTYKEGGEKIFDHLHKIQGALQYSGASKIEQTIQSISESIKEPREDNAKVIDLLIDNLTKEGEELEVWYLQYKNSGLY